MRVLQVTQKELTKAERFAKDVEAQIEKALDTKPKKAEAVYVAGEKAQTVGKIYKKVSKMLRRFSIPATWEEGCYWVRADKYDKEATRSLPAGEIATITVDIWVYYAEQEISVGVGEDYLFSCLEDEIDEIPLFLNAYFKSRFGKGKLVRKQVAE